LYVALDQEYITPEQFDRGYSLYDETMRLIGGFIAYLQKSPIEGAKYK